MTPAVRYASITTVFATMQNYIFLKNWAGPYNTGQQNLTFILAQAKKYLILIEL